VAKVDNLWITHCIIRLPPETIILGGGTIAGGNNPVKDTAYAGGKSIIIVIF